MHRSKKEKQDALRTFFFTEGNERADELAKGRAMETEQIDVVYAALRYAASFHCLVEE